MPLPPDFFSILLPLSLICEPSTVSSLAQIFTVPDLSMSSARSSPTTTAASSALNFISFELKPVSSFTSVKVWRPDSSLRSSPASWRSLPFTSSSTSPSTSLPRLPPTVSEWSTPTSTFFRPAILLQPRSSHGGVRGQRHVD